LAADDIVILWHNGLDSEIVLTDEKATSIYRIVQESLVNVLKHAHADQVIVTARRDNDVLVLQIEDDGIGISKESLTQIGYHYGLLGMIERATMIGATLSIVTEPGKGCTVTVMVKLKNSVN
jgi:signal transduction histidine kinase